MEFLYEYGLFLAKSSTLVVAIIIVLIAIVATAVKQKPKKGELEITDLSEQFEQTVHRLKSQMYSKEAMKLLEKKEKKQHKLEQKERKKSLKSAEKNGDEQLSESKPRLFVLNFKGSIDAKEVSALRREVSAVLAVADEGDEVLVSVESGGGMVHGYGLAASQLKRIKQKGLSLTIAVDKVAASGGYMMACIADRLIAAPFAIVGSIGVIAQVPNFNRVLKKHDIEFEQVTAGEYKRTLTMFGENDDKGREKFKQELEETHVLFKEFVSEMRPDLDISKVATGEHWYGTQALELGLIDKIQTSDDYLMESHEDKHLFKVKYVIHKKLSDKIAHSASLAFESTLGRLWQNARLPLLK